MNVSIKFPKTLTIFSTTDRIFANSFGNFFDDSFHNFLVALMTNILAIFRANFFLKIYLWKISLILFLILDQCVKFASLQNGGGMCNQNSF